jgi:hypothetical protein
MLFSKLELRQLKQKLVENAKLRREEKKDCYVYALLDPRKLGPFTYGHWKFSHEPFYIGKGKCNRIEIHNEKHGSNLFKANVIRKIKLTGFKDCLRVVKKGNLLSQEALALEILMIAKIGRRDLKLGPLTNLTDGGEGSISTINPKRESIRRKKISITLKNRTEEDLKLRNLKIAQTVASRSLNKKISISRNISKAHWNKSEEQRTFEGVCRANTWKNKPPEEFGKFLTKMAKINSDRTEEEKEIIRDKQSHTHNSKSEKEKAEIQEKKRLTMLSKTPEEKESARKKKQETWAKRTEEQKYETKKKYHTTLTKEKELERRKHISEGHLKRRIKQ